MTVQEAAEAANINSYQMQSSFGAHEIKPGGLTLNSQVPAWVRNDLRKRGYKIAFRTEPQAHSMPSGLTGSTAPFGVGRVIMERDYGIAW